MQGFAATLEETLVADLVLLVVDASAPDERLEEQEAAVRGVLHDIGADDLPLEVVVNKIDAADALRRRRLANRFPDAVQISALTGKGLDALRARIAERFADRFEAVHLFLPYEDGGKLAELYALGAPIDEREDHGRRRSRPRAPTAPRGAPLREVPRRRGPLGAGAARALIELPIQRLRDDAVVPERAYTGDAGLDLSACERVELGPGRASHWSAPGSPSRSRRATRASSNRVQGSLPATASRW